jgi:hypothetical protein
MTVVIERYVDTTVMRHAMGQALDSWLKHPRDLAVPDPTCSKGVKAVTNQEPIVKWKPQQVRE